MNRPLLKRIIARSAAWLAAAAVCTAVALAQQDAPATGQRTDGQIEMDVVHALDASAALKNDLITAATIQSQVTLSGTVSTDASKRLANQSSRVFPVSPASKTISRSAIPQAIQMPWVRRIKPRTIKTWRTTSSTPQERPGTTTARMPRLLVRPQ